MYRIALCDDENRELEKTEQMLYSYGKTRTDAEFHTECFLDAGEFILRVREKNYEPDILFLDTQTSHIKNGIRTLKNQYFGL